MSNNKTIQERFDEKWTPEPNSGCWLWTGNLSIFGYGMLTINGRITRAHRLSWTFHRGEIPEGLNVLHRCDIRNCVNPDHLFLGTHTDNANDRHRKGKSKASPKAGEVWHTLKRDKQNGRFVGAAEMARDAAEDR